MGKCRICGDDLKLIHQGTRDNPEINVYKCNACFTKQLDFIGENDYERGFMNDVLGMSENQIKIRLSECEQDDIRRFEYMKPYVKGKNILDFGCGFGGYLSRIKDYANEVSGCELGLDERSYLESIGINVHKDISSFNTRWDIITLFHVFEHLDNPNYWLDVFANNLREDGKLIIEVPNANDALLELYDCDRFADFTYWSAHVFLYTIESFRYLIDANEKFELCNVEQVQRYPLANHLYWLSVGRPGGQNVYRCLNDDSINRRYMELLSKKNMCDTLLFTLRKR